jgi:hypothetical protein
MRSQNGLGRALDQSVSSLSRFGKAFAHCVRLLDRFAGGSSRLGCLQRHIIAQKQP